MEYNLHPVLSGFPLPLLLLVGVIKIIEYFKLRESLSFAREVISLASLVGICLAFASGYQGNEWAEGSFKVEESYIASHHSIGRLLFFLSFPWVTLEILAGRVALNAKWFRIGAALLYCVCLGLALYAGYLGSQLVFSHGAGVTIENLHEKLTSMAHGIPSGL